MAVCEASIIQKTMTDLEESLSSETMVNGSHQPLKIAFHNLKYVVKNKKGGEMKTILKNISGDFCPGKLTGVLGSSGAGKTSLLNIISGFQTRGVSGSITVNDEPHNLRTLKSQCCYIEQEFTLLPLLTTMESLIIACDLKLGSTVNIHQKRKILHEILAVMKLEDASNTLVKYLSGGEKKRLAIGLELITNPTVMLFDEPTSGLDSFSSLQLMQHLKSLVEINKTTIVCVIHQPSSRIFGLLDCVLVLTDGKIMYSGPTSDIASSFSKDGYNVPKYYNIADFVLEVSKRHTNLEVKYCPHMNATALSERTEQSICSLVDTNTSNAALHSNLDRNKGSDLHDNNYLSTEIYTTGVMHQCSILLKREIMIAKRDLNTTYAKILIYLATGIVLGSVWFGIGNEADKVLSNIPLFFCGQTAAYFMCAAVTSLNYGKDVCVITREYRNNWYTVHGYFISKIISMLPLQVINSLILALPMYLLSGQILEMERVFTFCVIFTLMNMVGEYNGLLFGTLLKPEFALNMLLTIILVAVILSGFVIRLDELPIYSQWLAEINFYRFSFEASMQTIYGRNRTKLNCQKWYCYFQSPDKVLQEMHMTDDRILWDITGLIVWVIILQFLFYWVLNWKQRK